MNKKLLYLCLLLATLVIPTSQSAASRPAHAGQPQTTPPGHSVRARIAPRHILVKLEAATDVPAFMRHAKKQGLHKQGRVYGSYWYTLSLPAQANPRAAAARARHLPGVVMATVDPLVRLDQIPPRDPLYRDDDDPTTKIVTRLKKSVRMWISSTSGACSRQRLRMPGISRRAVALLLLRYLTAALILIMTILLAISGSIRVKWQMMVLIMIVNGLVDDVHGADFVGDNTGDPSTDDPASQDGNPDIPMGIWDPEVDIFAFTGDPSVGDGVDNDGDGLPDLGVFHGTAVAALAAAMTDNLAVELPGDYDMKVWPVCAGTARLCRYEWSMQRVAVLVRMRPQQFTMQPIWVRMCLNLSWGFDLDTLDEDTGPEELR